MGARLARIAKVLDSLAGILLAANKQRILALRGDSDQLVKGHGLSASLDDTLASSAGETESTDADTLGDGLKALVVGDGADNNDDAILLLGVFADGRQRDDGAVGAGHTQTLQNDLVEGGVSTARQECVQLDKQTQVRVLAPRKLPQSLLDMMLGDIDTLRNR